MLQTLWNFDQALDGAAPRRPNGLSLAGCGPHVLIVDEDVIQPGSAVDAARLFPVVRWNPALPACFSAFDHFVKTAFEFRDGRCPHRPFARTTRQYAERVATSCVMKTARKFLCDLPNRPPDVILSDDSAWARFIHRFWFTLEDWRDTQPKPIEDIHFFVKASDPQGTVLDLLNQFGREEAAVFFTRQDLLQHVEGGREGGLIDSFLQRPASEAESFLDQWVREKGNNPEARVYYDLLVAILKDLILLWRWNNQRTPPFFHILMGEFDPGRPTLLLGYHYWYKFRQDAGNAAPGAFTANELMYGPDSENLGRNTPEVTSFNFSMKLSYRGSDYTIGKNLGGFLNGCSPEGWMAICTLAFFRHLSQRQNELRFGSATVDVYVGETTYNVPTLATAYPHWV